MAQQYICVTPFKSLKGCVYYFNSIIRNIEFLTLSYIEQLNFRTEDGLKFSEEGTNFEDERYPKKNLTIK